MVDRSLVSMEDGISFPFLCRLLSGCQRSVYRLRLFRNWSERCGIAHRTWSESLGSCLVRRVVRLRWHTPLARSIEVLFSENSERKSETWHNGVTGTGPRLRSGSVNAQPFPTTPRTPLEFSKRTGFPPRRDTVPYPLGATKESAAPVPILPVRQVQTEL